MTLNWPDRYKFGTQPGCPRLCPTWWCYINSLYNTWDMFDSLKKRLKESVEKLTKKTWESVPPAEAPRVEREEKPPAREVPEELPKHEKHAPIPGEHRKPEIHEKIPEPELPKPEPVPEKEPERERRGFLGRVKERVATREISGDDIDEFFADMETGMLEANVALEVMDFLKQRLKEHIRRKQAGRFSAKNLVKEAFEDSLFDAVNQGDVDLESVIRKAKSEARPAGLLL